MRPLQVTMVLNYYAPYVSGLTQAARFVAEGLVQDGWKVTVVSSRHDPDLPLREQIAGVDVIRCRPLARISRGIICPAFPVVAASAMRRADVANLHLPMLEAGPIALMAGRTPTVTTYQCDVMLPPSRVNTLAIASLDRSAKVALAKSRFVCPSSADYAASSRIADAMEGRCRPIPPPCTDRSGGSPTFREGRGLHVGFLGRLVEEKGLDYLIEGFLALGDPSARLLLGGDYENVAGGSIVDRLRKAAKSHAGVRFLGFLPEDSLPDFYASLDVFAFPSINSTEAFGIAQVEAMLAGIPVIASDLPGVRTPVQQTGFGVIVRPRDGDAIARALKDLSEAGATSQRERARTRSLYGVARTVRLYADVFHEATQSKTA